MVDTVFLKCKTEELSIGHVGNNFIIFQNAFNFIPFSRILLPLTHIRISAFQIDGRSYKT